MDRGIRYEPLATDESDEVEAQEVGASAAATEEPEPAPTAAVTNASSITIDDNGTVPLIPQPPPYNIAVDLPTYEQAEQTKQEEEQRAGQRARELRNANTLWNRLWNGAPQEPDAQLGTDGMFLCTFLMAFVFNWIGLLTSMCVTQSVAGRLGAVSGFGLSLVKWVAIVKHSNWAGDVATNDSLLWWILILLGFVIFFRGSTQYIRIKFHWNRLNQHTRNNIFYYF